MSIASTSSQRGRQRQREAAVVAEGVEQPAARVARGRLAVLALIEEQPGLLAVIRIDLVVDRAPSRTSIVSGTVAVQHLDPLLEPFEQPDARIVAREDAGRLQQLDQQPR